MAYGEGNCPRAAVQRSLFLARDRGPQKATFPGQFRDDSGGQRAEYTRSGSASIPEYMRLHGMDKTRMGYS